QRREDDADAGDHLPGQDLPDPQGGGGGDRAPQGGDEGDHQQDPAPRGVEVEGGGPDADDRVQRDLGVQRGEQGHDAGGGAGVRAGQPAVDGHRAGLDAQRHQHDAECGGDAAVLSGRPGEDGEVDAAGRGVDEPDAGQQQGG